MLKRLFDVCASACLLILVLPVLAFAAILIKVDSEGPVFYCQHRAGRGFARFRLYKLRTMKTHQPGPAYSAGSDPRVTRVGRWLRHSKIDELPQLWNVLRGEMSLVGPRPVMPEIAQEFSGAYKELLTVRPGLTDPASLEYCDEAEILESVADPQRYFTTVVTPAKIRLSLAYLHRRSPWSDILVVLQTALALTLPALRRRFAHPQPRRKVVLPIVQRRARIAEAFAGLRATPQRGQAPRRLGIVRRSRLVQAVSEADSR